MNKKIQGTSKEVLELLMNYHYPGNIRELQNIIEHSIIVCRENIIQTHHLPNGIFETIKERPAQREDEQLKKQVVSSCNTLAQSEKKLIITTLEKNRWNRKKSAHELGINPSTLWRKMKSHNL